LRVTAGSMDLAPMHLLLVSVCSEELSREMVSFSCDLGRLEMVKQEARWIDVPDASLGS
jgi:hypothetical protein